MTAELRVRSYKNNTRLYQVLPWLGWKQHTKRIGFLDQHSAEAKAQYAKMLSEIQQLQNAVSRLKFGSVPESEGYVTCQDVLLRHISFSPCR